MSLLLFPAVLLIHLHILHRDLHIDLMVSLDDAIVSTLVLGGSLWGIILIIRAYPTTAAIHLYALGASVLLSATAVFGQYEILKWWSGPLQYRYHEWLFSTLHIRFICVLLFNTWLSTSSAMQKTITLSESRYQLQADASELLREAELFKLRQQLQPHFLYNSLNSISALTITDPDKAQDMIGRLSAFLRSSVRRESEELLPVHEELDYVRSYLDIESVRFGDRLHVHIINDADEALRIPPFLLQPIIENAIKFGLYGKTGEVTIAIQIHSDPGLLTIQITNPFDPDTQPPRGTGFGLDGIARRLWLLFGRNDLLDTRRYENTFTTILKIPVAHV